MRETKCGRNPELFYRAINTPLIWEGGLCIFSITESGHKRLLASSASVQSHVRQAEAQGQSCLCEPQKSRTAAEQYLQANVILSYNFVMRFLSPCQLLYLLNTGTSILTTTTTAAS